MQVFVEGLKAIVEFVQQFFQLLFGVLVWIFESLMWVVVQLIITICTGLMTIIHSFVSVLDVGVIATNAAASWGVVDSNVAGGVAAIGIPQGLTIIGGCIVVRMIINLIPAALTRI